MKKFLPALLSLLLILCLSAAASAETVIYPKTGFVLNLPEDHDDIRIEMLGDMDKFCALSIYYLNGEAIEPYDSEYEKLLATSDDQDAIEAAKAELVSQANLHLRMLYTIFGVRKDALEEYADYIAAADRGLGENSTHIYYVMSGDDNPDLAEEDRAAAEKALTAADEIMKTLSIVEIDPSDDLQSVTGILAGLSTVDMNGNPVDAGILSQADITVLHVWGTDCTPCIAEMPEMSAWAEALPENVQVIGLLVDVRSASDKTFARAEKILSKAGVGFVNLLNNETLNPLLENVLGTPTTYFFDRSGSIIADPVVGANLSAYQDTVNQLLGK